MDSEIWVQTIIIKTIRKASLLSHSLTHEWTIIADSYWILTAWQTLFKGFFMAYLVDFCNNPGSNSY